MTARAARTTEAMTEAQLMGAIVETARALNYLVYHATVARRSETGYPDLCIAGHGKLWFVECKTARGRLRPASVTKRGRVLPGQMDWLRALNYAGARAMVVRPADLDDMLAELRRGYEEATR